LPHVQGDRVQLQQLVLNLIMNACEAMQPDSRPERVLSIDTLHGANGTVHILVGDSGPGIARELRDRIFEPFYTTKADGLGLGLPICRKIAAAHGGTLSVDDVPRQGACFRIVLPALQAARPEARPAHFGAGAISEADSS
jgi:two-component system, LuxR family, sensor kinase FixL